MNVNLTKIISKLFGRNFSHIQPFSMILLPVHHGIKKILVYKKTQVYISNTGKYHANIYK